MKLIKKIAAIMFAFMMVVSMSCNVKADEGFYGDGDGTITITNAQVDKTYTIYEMLQLESFNGGNYSYKVADGWEDFFSTGEGANYMQKDGNGYMTYKTNMDTPENLREFAQTALAYAQQGHGIHSTSQQATTDTVTFSYLKLGYYLVDSSAGALCGLTTTNKNASIEEKNGVPTVEKTILESNKNDTENYANIGDVVKYQTIITAQKGAQTYVLHDTMDKGLTFNKDVKVKVSGQESYLNPTTDYVVAENQTCGCTFEITFTDAFLKTIKGKTNIEVTYSATLNADALIHLGNNNTTYLTYGNNNKTNTSETHTVTYEIKVLKYTNTKDHPLANAKFSLFNQETGGTVYKLVQKTDTTNYRLAMTGEDGITEITTNDTGKFSIQGLKPGVYWLEETAAPKGYNKLAKRIEVEIKQDGTLIVDKKSKDETNLPISQVNVENKSGTLLPSTGGMGTTMIYLVGAVLVLGSGIVLASKRRANSK